MKFVTYVHEIKESIGILENNNVFDIKDLLKKMGEKDIPGTMQKFIEYLDEDKSHKMELFLNNRVVEPVSLDSVKLKAPIPYPRRNVFCLGKNYEEHAREIKMTQISGNGIPEVPIYFTKVASPAV